MTAFVLKILASAFMLIDHIGAVFPAPDFFRYIGRMAFPIYLYLIAEGCTYSKNINKYAQRLGLFAIISEIPFDLALRQPNGIYRGLPLKINFTSNTNVFYTLFLGVFAVIIYKKILEKANQLPALLPLFLLSGLFFARGTVNSDLKMLGILVIYTICVLLLGIILPERKVAVQQDQIPAEEKSFKDLTREICALLAALPIALFGQLWGTDYGMIAIAVILFLYWAKTRKNKLSIMVLWVIAQYGANLVNPSFRSVSTVMLLVFALFAIVLLFFYNGRQGKKMKWGFYWFYPIHLSILAFILHVFLRHV